MSGRKSPSKSPPKSAPKSPPKSPPRSPPKSQPKSPPRSPPKSSPKSPPRSPPKSSPKSPPRSKKGRVRSRSLDSTPGTSGTQRQGVVATAPLLSTRSGPSTSSQSATAEQLAGVIPAAGKEPTTKRRSKSDSPAKPSSRRSPKKESVEKPILIPPELKFTPPDEEQPSFSGSRSEGPTVSLRSRPSMTKPLGRSPAKAEPQEQDRMDRLQVPQAHGMVLRRRSKQNLIESGIGIAPNSPLLKSSSPEQIPYPRSPRRRSDDSRGKEPVPGPSTSPRQAERSRRPETSPQEPGPSTSRRHSDRSRGSGTSQPGPSTSREMDVELVQGPGSSLETRARLRGHLLVRHTARFGRLPEPTSPSQQDDTNEEEEEAGSSADKPPRTKKPRKEDP